MNQCRIGVFACSGIGLMWLPAVWSMAAVRHTVCYQLLSATWEAAFLSRTLVAFIHSKATSSLAKCYLKPRENDFVSLLPSMLPFSGVINSLEMISNLLCASCVSLSTYQVILLHTAMMCSQRHFNLMLLEVKVL